MGSLALLWCMLIRSCQHRRASQHWPGSAGLPPLVLGVIRQFLQGGTKIHYMKNHVLLIRTTNKFCPGSLRIDGNILAGMGLQWQWYQRFLVKPRRRRIDLQEVSAAGIWGQPVDLIGVCLVRQVMVTTPICVVQRRILPSIQRQGRCS